MILPSRASQDRVSQDNYLKVKDIVRELKIPMIDFHRHLYGMQDPLSFYALESEMHHYNLEGYKLLTELILKEAFGK